MVDRVKASCQLCQDDRQAVGCRQNPGVHCVLFTYSSFLLEADQVHLGPKCELVGRDGGSGRRKEGREVGNGTTCPCQLNTVGINFNYMEEKKESNLLRCSNAYIEFICSSDILNPTLCIKSSMHANEKR